MCTSTLVVCRTEYDTKSRGRTKKLRQKNKNYINGGGT